MDVMQQYEAWLHSPVVDAATRAELAAIGTNAREIEERFYRELEFGTAGLRGILGAGTNRMNVYVVRRATQGLANYLSGVDGAKERGVCIAYDSRHFSKEFAAETAMTLAANGIRVYLFESLRGVPQLSFTLRRLRCIAGVVITASHNPKQYNGYKVYWEHGGQVAPNQAAAIFDCIEAAPIFEAKTMELDAARACGRITMLGAEADEAYYEATAGLRLCKNTLATHGAELKLVYTPLHGSGYVPVTTLLKRIGVTNVAVVPEQAQPDGDFPTVAAPNPEDPNAFKLAIALAGRTGATVCLATDPDADRLGVAVKTRVGDWVTLTGNQIGAILIEHILSALKNQNRLPSNGVVIKSIVSTRLADAICRAYGVEIEDVMTGFRFIGEKIAEYAENGKKEFLFGFEESFGFLSGGLSRDKDAICAAMLAAETCVVCRQKGLTLYDMLEDIYARYGYYKEKVKSYTLEGKAGMERIAYCMRSLCENPPDAVAGIAVDAAEDYLARTHTARDGVVSPLALPRGSMLRLLLDNGAWIVVRPSGTEPKLKLYIGANAASEQAVDALLASLYTDIGARVSQLLQ